MAEIAQLLKKKTRPGETLIQGLLFFCAAVSILTTAGIIYALAGDAFGFFTRPEVNFWAFFTQTEWEPGLGKFGILPLFNATLLTSLIAMLIALPLGLAVGLYLSEYAPAKVSRTLKPILELLAGVPSIVFGFFALTFITPGLINLFGDGLVQPYNLASAGLVMGLLIFPVIASMTEDAFSAVPRHLKLAGFAMGATKLEVGLKITLPAATSGVVAAVILGLSRAIGETMIVALAAGSSSKLTFNPFESAETMTGNIVRVSGGDLPYQSLAYSSLFAIALLLFVITLLLNMLSRRIIERFREVYE